LGIQSAFDDGKKIIVREGEGTVNTTGPHKDDEEELERKSVESLKKDLEDLKKLRRQDWRSKIVISLLGFLVFWGVGSVAYTQLENWSYGNSIWFSYVAFTTVGYGDLYPQTQEGRAFFVGWSLFGAANVTIFFSILQEAWAAHYKHLHSQNPYELSEEDEPYLKELGLPVPHKIAEDDPTEKEKAQIKETINQASLSESSDEESDREISKREKAIEDKTHGTRQDENPLGKIRDWERDLKAQLGEWEQNRNPENVINELRERLSILDRLLNQNVKKQE